ncbi:hypothetical protein ABT126_21050 [Streptomyces sp. NPDC002012]|uniref:hypothetical protein n=1 Tax=Streptomyces sp. NPDC002012 TaxID=3154532 RepID=UPI00332E7848
MCDRIGEILPEVLGGTIEPGRVLNLGRLLAATAEACAATDERRVVEVVLRP